MENHTSHSGVTPFYTLQYNKWKIKRVASGGFDPPTLGLWALCASSAPTRLSILVNLPHIKDTEI